MLLKMVLHLQLRSANSKEVTMKQHCLPCQVPFTTCTHQLCGQARKMILLCTAVVSA